MQPHELKPLRKRLTAKELADRALRIAKRIKTFRYTRPLDLTSIRWPATRLHKTSGHTHDGERARRRRAKERGAGKYSERFFSRGVRV